MKISAVLFGALALIVAILPEQASAQGQSTPAVGSTFRECDSACPEMVVVPAGQVSLPPARMSDLATRGDPLIASGMDATFERPFAVSKYPVTVAEYGAFVHDTNRTQDIGCRTWEKGFQFDFDANAGWDHPGFEQSPTHPVVCVNWDDARAYVKWLNMRLTGSKDGESGPYRLPTWAEAAYSARAGATTAYFWGDQLGRHFANYGADDCDPCRGVKEGDDRWIETSPVGSFPPNNWGLYDVAGNVYQITDTSIDVLGAQHGYRFTYGGSWLSKGSALALSAQGADDIVSRSSDTGFRLVRTIDAEHPVRHLAGDALTRDDQPYKWGRHFQDCADCPDMVAIPQGTFQTTAVYDAASGDDSASAGIMDVAIDHPYAIGRFDVTVAQYRAFVRDTGKTDTGGCQVLERDKWQWVEKADRSWESPGFKQTDSDPVVCVSWNDATEYVAWLNAKASKSNGSASPPGTYRLPSAQEWQYAATGGQRYPTKGYYYGFLSSHDFANFGGTPCCTSKRQGRDQWDYTSPVGSFPPNAFGFYDAVGNVWQMTLDCWDNRPDQFTTLPRHGEPRLTGSCLQHETWGASFDDEGVDILGDGNPYPATSRNFANGFRVVKALN